FLPVAKNEMVHTLLAKSPPLEFYELCGLGRSAEVAKQVAAHPDLATSWTKWGWSVLHLAAFSGDVETVRILVEHGADIQARARTQFLNTPLQTALLAGQFDTTKYLLEHGADALVRQSKGFAPIHEAVFIGRQDLVDLLLAHGAEIDAR